MPAPDFLPANPGVADRVRSSFAQQAAMTLIGAELLDAAPGSIVMRLVYSAHVTQQHGLIHAGIVSTALDSARGPLLRVEGRGTKAGRTITGRDDVRH